MDFHSIQSFIKEHSADLPDKLRLKYHSTQTPWVEVAISHIESSGKAAKKLRHLCPELLPNLVSVEQATSCEVAELHGRIASELGLDKTHRYVDMTCGMGIDMRAIVSATDVTAVGLEINAQLAEVTAYNFRDLKNVEILNIDSITWLREQSAICEQFEMVFIDPARRDVSGKKIFNLHDCFPDVISLLPMLKTITQKIMIKMSPMLDISQTLRDIPKLCQLWVVEHQGECRELLGIIDETGNYGSENKEIIVWSDSKQLKYKVSKEVAKVNSYGMPDVDDWLYEPSPAMMKVLSYIDFNGLYGLTKIAPNSQLFYSKEPKEELPGRWMRIKEISTKGYVKEIKGRYERGEVAVRNFPMSADELRSKLRLKDGGEWRFMATTFYNGTKGILHLAKQ